MKHHPEWSPEKMVRISVSKCKRFIKRYDETFLDRINEYNEFYGKISSSN